MKITLDKTMIVKKVILKNIKTLIKEKFFNYKKKFT